MWVSEPVMLTESTLADFTDVTLVSNDAHWRLYCHCCDLRKDTDDHDNPDDSDDPYDHDSHDERYLATQII